jgi:3-phosphoshikimate 1-carboxyvinyltransferase
VDGRHTLRGEEYVVDCGNCGTTLRFLIPLALLAKKRITFTGDESLTFPHFNKYLELFDQFGIRYHCAENRLPLTVENGDMTGNIELVHTVNSQFLSGLLFALPLFPYDSEIRFDAPLDTKVHIDLTLDILSRYGVHVSNLGHRVFRVHGGQMYLPCNYTVEGDYSHAAFYLALGAIGSFTICKGLPQNTKQSEKAMFEIIEKFGCKVVSEQDAAAAIPLALTGCHINISENPELLPVVALLGIYAKGETAISGVERAADFDSDLLTHITDQFNSLGATIIEKPNGLIIEGSPSITGGTADSCNNGKLAMMIAIASAFAENEIVLENSDVVKKTYPNFWDDFIALGGRLG